MRRSKIYCEEQLSKLKDFFMKEVEENSGKISKEVQDIALEIKQFKDFLDINKSKEYEEVSLYRLLIQLEKK